MLTIRLPTDIEDRLRKLSEATGRTRSSVVLEAIIQHLDNLEDLYLAEQRLADLKAGRTKVTPIEQVMRSYGLSS
jgi:RHH-type transcriptional regulator, rel operon repressor / antitoxin RelB